MSALNKVKDTVISILAKNEKARNSDSLLYLIVLQTVNKDLLNMPVREFLSRMSELNVPPFESVRRARQKAQAENPSLSACAKVAEHREANEEEYRRFAKSGAYANTVMVCPVCKKTFIPAPYHIYKEKKSSGKLVCSYHCMLKSRGEKVNYES